MQNAFRSRAGTFPQAEAILDALRAGRVELAFQPVVQRAPVRAIGFFEGLARIRLRDGSLLPPILFLPTLEDAGRLGQLDRFSLRQALTALQHDRFARVSVNVSLQTLADPSWMNLLRREAVDRPGNTDRLIIEVTERAVHDPDIVGPFVRTVRMMGVSVVLDDFGAGQTAFRQLRDLPLDGVKIDGSFCRDVTRDRDAQCFVRALVDIARHFEMFTVAEFVSSEQDAATLETLGVDLLQGYHFGSPSALPDRVGGRGAWLQDLRTSSES